MTTSTGVEKIGYVAIFVFCVAYGKYKSFWNWGGCEKGIEYGMFWTLCRLMCVEESGYLLENSKGEDLTGKWV